MFKLVSVLFFVLFSLQLNAQTHQFIYIENLYKQPFTVKVNESKMESNGKNFITLPKLEIGTYKLLISTNNSIDNKFTIAVTEEDAGYTLKQNTYNEWVLFDINKFITIEQDGKNIIETPPAIIKELVNNKATEIAKVVESVDSTKLIIAAINTKKTEQIEPAKKAILSIKDQPKRIYHNTTEDGVDQIYITNNGSVIDTVSLFIPIEKTVETNNLTEAKADVNKKQKIENNNIDVAKEVVNICQNVASEKDISNFSAKLQEAPLLKNKLKIANATLKDKCFTVNQIKRLSVLFSNDSGKFIFFKLAQTSISDAPNFINLAKEIKDEKLQLELKALTNTQ